MTDDCNFEDASTSLNFEFKVCQEHETVIPVSGALTSGGVPPWEIMNAYLGVIEELITMTLATMPQIEEYVKREYDGDPLTEGTQKRIVGMLAHQTLLRTVAERGYVRPKDSAFLVL